jgi:hypothetical protein
MGGLYSNQEVITWAQQPLLVKINMCSYPSKEFYFYLFG